MASYGEHVLSQTIKLPAAGSGSKTYTFSNFTIPDGESFYRYKITSTYASSYCTMSKPASAVGWGSWSTDKSAIKWTNGGHPSITVTNNKDYAYNNTFKITFQTKYTKVVAGNKIMAADRKKSGTSTTAGTIIKGNDSASSVAFTAGTIITASAFNSGFGYTG